MIVLVVGAGRSGTTTTAKILAERLGIDMGRRFAMSKDDKFHCYEEDGMYGLECGFLRGNLAINEYRHALYANICYRNDIAKLSGRPWGFKSPTLCYTLRLWFAYLPEFPYIIWAYRDPEKVAKSYCKVYGWDIHTARKEYNQRMMNLKAHLIGIPCLRVDFSEQVDEDALEHDLREFLSNKDLPEAMREVANVS